MERITGCVAGIRLRFETEEPLHFSERGRAFRGFAVDDDMEPVDMTIRFRDVEGEHDESDRVNCFVGDCRGTEMPDHRWEYGTTGDGREYIVVDSFTDALAYHWLKLRMGENEGEVELCRKDKGNFFIDPYIYPLFSIMFSRLLKRRGSFLIHSSIVDDNGKGYLFTAVSGTGKSTMAKIWGGEGATIINDDMNALICKEDCIEANNIPMPYYSDRPKRVELKGIFLISQSKTNFVRRVTGAQSVLRLAANTINQPCTAMQSIAHMQMVDKVAKLVPIYELGFKPDADIVHEVRKMME